jgi:glucose/arabinose dehydrogenase
MIKRIRTTGALLALTSVISAPTIQALAEELSTKSGEVNVERLAKLDNPSGMTFLPDGRLLITEKPGRMRIFADGKLSAPISGLPKIQYHGAGERADQGGLLDVEIDRDFASNGLVYFTYTEAAQPQPKDARDVPDPRLGQYWDKDDNVLKGAVVARGQLDGGDLRDVKVIWSQIPKTLGRGHFGGRLVFAPDGKLFVTSGDRQRFEPAQDLGSNLGKVVRINADGSIPNDNPFVNKEGALPDVWTYGHRNLFGAAINPTSQQLWIHEMGPKGGDEVNVVDQGRNYGWPVVSNGDNYDDSPIPDHPTRPEFAPPIQFWNPSISPSGLLFYTGSLFPSWQGNALIGGMSSKALIRLTLDGDRVTGEERIDMRRRIRDVIQAHDGAVMLLSDGNDGELLRLTPKGKTPG